MKISTSKKSLLLAVCFVFVLAFTGTCQAAEIQTDELDRLEIIFNQLENNLEQQEAKYQQALALSEKSMLQQAKLGDQLANANESLEKSSQQQAKLEAQLKLADQSINQAEASLSKANLSLKKLDSEIKHERNARKIERALWITLAIYQATH